MTIYIRFFHCCQLRYQHELHKICFGKSTHLFDVCICILKTIVFVNRKLWINTVYRQVSSDDIFQNVICEHEANNTPMNFQNEKNFQNYSGKPFIIHSRAP